MTRFELIYTYKGAGKRRENYKITLIAEGHGQEARDAAYKYFSRIFDAECQSVCLREVNGSGPVMSVGTPKRMTAKEVLAVVTTLLK